MDLTKLNDKQKEAVLHTEGPLLIMAGAGSGKTRVLTNRVAYLIEEKGIDASNILAITFTNKAAKEMKERIIDLIGNKAVSAQISTFHSFGVRILTENYEFLGYSKNFTIFDNDDSITLIKKILKELNIDSKLYSPKGIKQRISGAKNELINPSDYEKYVNTDFEEVVYKVYKKYEDSLKKNGCVDFDDLLILPIKLFSEYPNVLKKYQEKFKYILIDEYQDTNRAQYTLVKMISAKYKNICVVGDSDQCLLPDTLIETKKGLRCIKDIKKGDLVLSASGFGKTVYSEVTSVSKKKYQGKVIKIKTEKGSELTGTFNHILFSNLDLTPDKYYIYLMYKKNMGYRIGQTSSLRKARSDKIVNGLMGRLNGELADKIWLIKICDTKSEATYFEELISIKYGLPKVVFHDKGRGIVLTQEQINDIYKNIDTEDRAQLLMSDYGLMFDYPHHTAQGTTTKDRTRQYVNINFFGGKYNKTRDMHTHRIGLNNSNFKDRQLLANLGFPNRDGKLNTWRLETERTTLEETMTYVQMINSLTSGYELVLKVHLTSDKNYRFINMGSLREGMSVVVKSGNKLIEDKVKEISFIDYEGDIHDINIDSTFNYIANGISVHNSIYSFRGADYQNILNFENDYKDTKVILLEENYRSTKNILNAANNVIKNNKKRKEKNLWCDNEDGVKIKYFRAFDEKDEAFYVIREIKKLIQERVPYNEIAILYRTNAQSRIVEEELLRENIPYKVIGSFFFYSRKEIKDLIAYLKLIVNEKDDISLMRVINEPKRGIGLKTLSDITRKANDSDISMFEAIDSGKELGFKELILDLKEYSEKSTLTDLVDYVLNKSGMKEALRSEKTLEADIRLENLEEFKSITMGFEEKYGEISLEDFLMEITLVSDMSEHNDIDDAVRLMTVHSVKGLEFNNVFIIGLEEGIFPHINSMLSNTEIEEERRLCYVAITRAKKQLYFVNARRRLLYGQDQVNPPSRFIKEVGDEYLESKEIEEPKFNKKEMLHNENQDYKIGDKVGHDSYGKGVIVGIDSNLISVVFAGVSGIKKFMKNHKSIYKL